MRRSTHFWRLLAAKWKDQLTFEDYWVHSEKINSHLKIAGCKMRRSTHIWRFLAVQWEDQLTFEDHWLHNEKSTHIWRLLAAKWEDQLTFEDHWLHNDINSLSCVLLNIYLHSKLYRFFFNLSGHIANFVTCIFPYLSNLFHSQWKKTLSSNADSC